MSEVLVPYLCLSGKTYSVYLLPDVWRPTPPAQQVIIRRASSTDPANIDRWNKEAAMAADWTNPQSAKPKSRGEVWPTP